MRYGFKKVNKSGAYKGAYYIKDGKKWIFDINALKYQLGVSDDDELEELGYDVDAYYRYN